MTQVKTCQIIDMRMTIGVTILDQVRIEFIIINVPVRGEGW